MADDTSGTGGVPDVFLINGEIIVNVALHKGRMTAIFPVFGPADEPAKSLKNPSIVETNKKKAPGGGVPHK